jgi:hypothetical protein
MQHQLLLHRRSGLHVHRPVSFRSLCDCSRSARMRCACWIVQLVVLRMHCVHVLLKATCAKHLVGVALVRTGPTANTAIVQLPLGTEPVACRAVPITLRHSGRDQDWLSLCTATLTGPKWLQHKYSKYQIVWCGEAAGSTIARTPNADTVWWEAQPQRGGARLNPNSLNRC